MLACRFDWELTDVIERFCHTMYTTHKRPTPWLIMTVHNLGLLSFTCGYMGLFAVIIAPSETNKYILLGRTSTVQVLVILLLISYKLASVGIFIN